MTPLPPDTAAALRQRLLTDLAKGATWRAALANARLVHPESSEVLDELETLQVGSRVGRVITPAAKNTGGEVVNTLTGWVEFYVAGAFSLAVAGVIAQLLSAKVTPALCQIAGPLAAGDPALCGGRLALLGTVAVALALAAVVATVGPLMRRVRVGRQLAHAGRLANLGLGVGDAIEMVFGTSVARELPRDYLEAADARHSAAAAWLLEVGQRIIARPDGPRLRAVGWSVHAAAWVLGAYVALVVYGATFTLAGRVP